MLTGVTIVVPSGPVTTVWMYAVPSRPFQRSENCLYLATGRSRTSVATVRPAESVIVTVTSSAWASLNEISSSLMCPDGVGEKMGVN